MRKIKELLELARHSYALAKSATHPEAKIALQDIAAKYLERAEERRKSIITPAVFPSHKQID